MRTALVVGGANGIGLAIATELANDKECKKVYIVDRCMPQPEFCNAKFECHLFDLCQPDYSIFRQFKDVDTLMITAGFGKLALFKDVDEQHIIDSMNVNATAVMRIIHCFYERIS